MENFIFCAVILFDLQKVWFRIETYLVIAAKSAIKKRL